MSNKLEKFATPHDELMALAGKWLEKAQALDAQYDRERAEADQQWLAGKSEGLDECHSELVALLDSDAFRAMVRDAWQPIETAPEGEAVHVYTPDIGDGERFGIDVLVDGAWQEHAESYDHYIAVGGAGACGPGVICTGPGPDAPYTHWRPLTPPQAIDAAASGAGEW